MQKNPEDIGDEKNRQQNDAALSGIMQGYRLQKWGTRSQTRLLSSTGAAPAAGQLEPHSSSVRPRHIASQQPPVATMRGFCQRSIRKLDEV